LIQGVVIGEVWATRKSPRLRNRKLLLVAETSDAGKGMDPTGRVLVAADNLDAGQGDRVVVAFGSGARNAIEPRSRDVLVDAAVVQIIEGRSA